MPDEKDTTFAELFSANPLPAESSALETNARPAPSVRSGYYTEISDFKRLAKPPASYHDPSTKKADLERLKKGSTQHSIDLHGYTKKEAVQQVANHIGKCQSRAVRYFLVIFGQGKTTGKPAVLKPEICSYLIAHPEVLAYHKAKPQHGGSGAAYVLIKT